MTPSTAGPAGRGVDAEGAVDATAAAFAAGTHTNVTVTYNDTAGSISLAAAAGGVTDPELLAIAGLTSAADKGFYFTGSGTAAIMDMPAQARTFLTATSVAAQQGALNLSTDFAAKRRPMNTLTGTTFTPNNNYENTMCLLSNVAAIIVTLPQTGFTEGAEIDFCWYGVGRPSFVAGSGATIVSSFGLSMPARYCVVTAKKIGSAEWLLYQGGESVRLVIVYTGTAVTGALTDAGSYLRFTGTNPTYTVPPNSAVAFPVGTQIDGIGSATAMTLIQGSGVTITKARTLVTVGAGSGWTLIKTATDAWDLHGDLV